MTTDDQLDIIHSYGKTKYWDSDDEPNRVIVVIHNTNEMSHPACGTGYCHDDTVDSLYRALRARMLTVVRGIEDDDYL